MAHFPDDCPAAAAGGDAAARLRDGLDRGGYTEAAVAGMLGLAEPPADRRLKHDLPLYLWRTRDPSPLATLVRLFLLGQPVSTAAAADALRPLALDDGVRCGLLTADAAGVRAAVQIIPYQDVWVAADWPDAAVAEPVMGVAASTRALAQMMIPGPVGRALDLGTGSGVLALLAARDAARVVAVDLNPRAVAVTAFNARLNGVGNVEARAGDLFDPVRGEAFDRIVCNPPFVIAPAAGRLHSRAGRPADDLFRSIVRAAPEFLRPGGFCQVVGNWVHPAGGDWRERLAGWFAGLGCDAWVLHARTEDAATYAHQRVAETTDDPAEAARLFDEWVAYYGQAGIAAVGFGVITLRRSDKPACWFRCDRLPDAAGPCGAAIARGFALRDFLDAHRDDQALLAARVRRADGLRWDRRSDLAAGGWAVAESQLRLTTGLAFAGAAEAAVAEFVAGCTGGATLGDDLSRLAAKLGRDRRQFAPAFLALVRRLIEVGILVPADVS
ncbi:MAG TPA: methyltransferase [Gemmataceae bacterium]|jgi:SAM-dependent methyltransferase